jgi:hypothetical protein
MVIMRVMVDRGDLELNIGSETLRVGGRGAGLVFFTLPKFHL